MNTTGVRRRKGPNIVEKEPEPVQIAHRSIRWVKAACFSLFVTCIVFPIIILLIPSPIDPVEFSLPKPPAWTGPLSPNTHLQKATRMFENQILGPESMTMDGEYLYAGTADGKVVEIYKGNLRTLTRLGQEPCGRFEDEPTCGRPLGMRIDKDGYLIVVDAYLGLFKVNVATGTSKPGLVWERVKLPLSSGRFEDEPTCGRPLGMRIDKDGYLIVVDAYLGLFKVNVATGDSTLLWPSTAPINGKVPKLLNDIDIAGDGMIYMTDSSTRWDRRHNRWLVMEGENTGRLISYDPINNITKELVSGIAFANGVQVTRDQKSLLLVSTTKAAVYKYHLEGPKKGLLEPFNDNLPGLPDNIRKSSLGGYWVGLAAVRKPPFSLVDFGAPRPWIRTLVSKFFTQEVLMKMVPKYGLLIHLDETGKITKTLHDPTGKKLPSVSEVEDNDGVLYLGSYNLPFLSKLYMVDIK